MRASRAQWESMYVPLSGHVVDFGLALVELLESLLVLVGVDPRGLTLLQERLQEAVVRKHKVGTALREGDVRSQNHRSEGHELEPGRHVADRRDIGSQLGFEEAKGGLGRDPVCCYEGRCQCQSKVHTLVRVQGLSPFQGAARGNRDALLVGSHNVGAGSGLDAHAFSSSSSSTGGSLLEHFLFFLESITHTLYGKSISKFNRRQLDKNDQNKRADAFFCKFPERTLLN